MKEAEAPPALRLSVATDRPVRLSDAGKIFVRLNDSYIRHQIALTPDRVPDALRLERVEVGSLFADLSAVGDALTTLWEKREALAGFVTHLAEVVEYLTGVRAGRVRAADRATIEAMAAPVANDNARQVSLQVIGDNNTVLIIDAHLAKSIQSGLVSATRVPIDADDESLDTIEEYNKRLDVGFSFFGPARLVNGKWYAQAVPHRDIIVPLSANATLLNELEDGVSYAWDGEMIPDEENPDRLVARHAMRMGGGGSQPVLGLLSPDQ